MKGDFSKNSFKAKKHFRQVLMQQGRVLLDTDWNEQSEIINHRVETETEDVIGKSGAPMNDAGFQILPSSDSAGSIEIGKGRYYVDGILCENDENVLFQSQPDFNGQVLPEADGQYIFYLDVWQRHITVWEDSDIQEVALGGPDTTTRSKTVWQVKWLQGSDSVCSDPLPFVSPTGKLNARTTPAEADGDPCGLASSGGYKRLENQLYRVEVHKSGNTIGEASFKWSRDNGSVVTKWIGQDSSNHNNLIVSTIGRDEILNFKGGDWIELIDNDTDLQNSPGVMVQIASVNGNVITINPLTISDPNNSSATEVTISPKEKNPRIRRWDSDGEMKIKANTWTAIEDGVEISLTAGSYNSGDYWLIPARTATANVIGDIEWPYSSAQPPRGIQHHYAKLAMVKLEGETWNVVSDCRHLFPPLTDLVSLHYVGGDGQEAMPGSALPASLKVGVANGKWAVEGARVRFEILSGGGSLSPANGLVSTNADGLAECKWTLGTGTSNLLLQVKATLLDDKGAPMQDVLAIIFNASYSIASNVAYTPNCQNWVGQAPQNVAEALDQLCMREGGKGSACSMTIGKGGDFATLEEAIEILIKNQIRRVTLCFLPGEHVIEKDIDVMRIQASFDMLKISGHSALVTMNSQILTLVGKELIEWYGVNLNTSLGAENKNITFYSGSVKIEHCNFDIYGKSILNYVRVSQNAFVHIADNLMVNRTRLVLDNGTKGVITANRIPQIVINSNNPEEFSPLLWKNLDEKKGLLEVLSRRFPEEYVINPWSLSITGNQVQRIVTNNANPKPRPTYQNLIIAENIFSLGQNSFVSQFVNLSNNQFLAASGNQQNTSEVLAYVLGYYIIVNGNSNFPGMLSLAGAPLGNYIDVLSLGSVKGAGPLSQQIMNLVNVVT